MADYPNNAETNADAEREHTTQIPQPRAPRPEAIALRYDPDQEQAPRVVARGQGNIAERILSLARENNIPLYEDEDLVHLLSVLEINAEIPSNLYRALAEVLAHIYRANNALDKKIKP